MMKRSLATKRILESLSAGIGGGNGTDTSPKDAMKLLTRVPQHRRQYVFVSEAAEQLADLSTHKDKELVKKFIAELRSSYVSGIDHEAKEKERPLLECIKLSENVATSSSTVAEKLFALTENWSAEERVKRNGGMIRASMVAERVVLTEDAVDAAVEQGETDTASAEADAGIEPLDEGTYPLGLLLSIAANHFNKEYSGLLSEAQMTFLTSYVTTEPEVFISKSLVPLEEAATRAVTTISESDDTSSKVAPVLSLIGKFRNERNIFSEVSHPQHNVAMNFYLSLVELVDRINSK